ncbi:enolase C-terminal domain-like protein [Rhodoglobus aureus]|uniref:Enolase C-terminal domain-like protein n=1 Tax=Rhodoglobus aureus TaxID=191497 RepID=A0ABN1VIV4_9MICO
MAIDSAPWYGKSTPAGEQKSFQFPLLEITSDSGISGYSTGYCPLGQGRGAAQQLIDVYSRVLIGRDPTGIEAIWQDMRRMNRHLYALSDASTGQIDVALWDLKGKALGSSIGTLLGRTRDSVGAYGTGSYFLESPEETAREALLIRDRGYSGAKFNMFQGPAIDIPKLEAARDAVGPDFSLMLDASNHLSYADALTTGRALGRLDFDWFEEPLYDRQLGQLLELRKALDVPILGAETVSLMELADAMTRSTFDLVRGDVYIKAGVTGLVKAIGMTDLLGVGLEIHACASPLLDIANLHVACATATTDRLEVHHEMFRFGVLDNPMVLDSEGRLTCPDGPGLGVEMGWDWIDDHTVELVIADPLA